MLRVLIDSMVHPLLCALYFPSITPQKPVRFKNPTEIHLILLGVQIWVHITEGRVDSILAYGQDLSTERVDISFASRLPRRSPTSLRRCPSNVWYAPVQDDG